MRFPITLALPGRWQDPAQEHIDGPPHLRLAGWGAKAQHDLQMQVVADQAHEVVGEPAAMMVPDLACCLGRLEQFGKSCRRACRSTFEEDASQFRMARGFVNYRRVP